MVAFFLLLVIVAMVLGIVGVVVFLGAFLLGALWMRRRPGKRSAR